MPTPNLLTFTAPTKYRVEDGAGAIPAGAIVKYEYRFSNATNPSLRIVTDTDLTPSGGKQVGSIPSDLPLGDYSVEARSITAEGAASDWSAKVPFSVTPKVPATITDLAVS